MRLLTTPRLRLEPLVAAHADEMFRVLSDPAIYEFENEAPASPAWLRERYARLETRCSADGHQQWLNWVLRLNAGEAIGHVQATVLADRRSLVAYELSSAFWGRGLAHEAVERVIPELVDHYRVRRLLAVLKTANQRSRRLLDRLGFCVATTDEIAGEDVAADELLMARPVRGA
jgi:[ribosomal protein S5]-alanine N-acetyltransferase